MDYNAAMQKMYESFDIPEEAVRLVGDAERCLDKSFSEADRIAEYNQLKVVNAMQKNHVSDACMLESTGYGYNDIGRDTLEGVYADVFGTDAALVRSQIVCGTHALTVALAGNTRPGDVIYSPCGMPYDTLQTVIGISNAPGSLKEYGIGFEYTELTPEYSFDYDGIKEALKNRAIRLVEIQRSRGYSLRPSFSNSQIAQLAGFIRGLRDDVIIMVDNCYGEFTDYNEPTELGADIAVGSLIKNPGGGIAPVGGYIAGKKEYVDNASWRLTAPGLGAELGPSLGNNRSLYQGLFFAPTVTAAAKKGAMLLSEVYSRLGFEVSPCPGEKRSDIIQTVTFRDPERVVSFCRGIQAAAAVDCFAAPEPAPMPGYDSNIIMAAGCFVQGSSIELSADGPLREPYSVFFQGGLTYAHSKLGVLMSLRQLVRDGFLKM